MHGTLFIMVMKTIPMSNQFKFQKERKRFNSSDTACAYLQLFFLFLSSCCQLAIFYSENNGGCDSSIGNVTLFVNVYTAC